jgi:hypothetical protein
VPCIYTRPVPYNLYISDTWTIDEYDEIINKPCGAKWTNWSKLVKIYLVEHARITLFTLNVIVDKSYTIIIYGRGLTFAHHNISKHPFPDSWIFGVGDTLRTSLCYFGIYFIVNYLDILHHLILKIHGTCKY